MKTTIPLFPLNLVVFPSSKRPLHIFEERYKIMINDCLQNNTGFGITTVADNEVSRIGSYVLITEVLKKYDNGEIDIVVQCRERFEINTTEAGMHGFLVADVSDYNDINSDVDESLLSKMLSKFKELTERVSLKLEDNFWKNYEKSTRKSFKLAEKAGLTLELQQKLLSLRDENNRMELIIDHLEKLDEIIDENLAVRSLVLGDGFLN